MFLLKNVDINISEGSVFSIIAILIVFTILLFLVLTVELLAKFKIGKKPQEKQEEVQAPIVEHKRITIEDIKDEDMMVAALIATAEFVEETKETDARLVSIKQIG
ncbi:MAG: OadG family protein [Bacilli bacterium]|nr:OadG family protein [Bacilli bacterium]